ncbi:MAG: class I SAM-dependent methyltransferase [Deltaproteobacteria bacterium]|nr:class I SAM-dependent methyltransferase [Deltaproteobacteria bacterium]
MKGEGGKRPKIWVERIPGPFASIYEKATRMVRETYYVPVAEEVVSFLASGRVLDLGTGPGCLPVEIAKRSSHIRVEGIDLSRRLIETARSNAGRAGVGDRVHFEVGDASRLMRDDDTYDMVISTGMLHILKDPVRVLKECRRVLKPGGNAWIYDPARVCSQVDIRKWKAAFSHREWIYYGLFLLFARINPGRTYDRGQVAAMVKAAGFGNYDIREEGGEIRARMTKGSVFRQAPGRLNSSVVTSLFLQSVEICAICGSFCCYYWWPGIALYPFPTLLMRK